MDEPTGASLERWRTKNDDAAFDVLYRRFYNPLCSYVRLHRTFSLLQAHGWSFEDIAQECWARFYPVARERLIDPEHGEFLKLLKSTSGREMIDLTRRATRDKRGGGIATADLADTPDVEANLVPGLPTPETPTGAARYSDFKVLAKAVLLEQEYDVWQRVDLDGRTPSEVATELGVSGPKIRGLLFRSRAKLARHLEVPDADSSTG